MKAVTSEPQSTVLPNSVASSSMKDAPASPDIVLPDKPLVTIEPTRSWAALNLRDVWQYRELLYILAERDVKVRYKQTALGAAWAVLQPLLTMLVFSVFFGRLAGIQSDGVPYALFAYAGLLPWIFFSGAVLASSNSLVGSAHLITKVYFPRLIIPIATVASKLVDFAVSFALLVVLMIWYGVAPGLNLLMLPVLILLTMMFAIGTGTLLSALNVKYRDIGQVLPFLVQLWLFATPIIYPLSMLPPRFQTILALNPLTGIIEGYRSALFNLPFNWLALGISTVITITVLIYAAFTFRRMERSFADSV